jgi:phage terminase small subunit
MAQTTAGPDGPRRLPPKQEAFLAAYLGEARFNATKAAKIAGYSERSARSYGPELLQNPDIIARVRAELTARAMPAEAVLAELTDVATAEWREFVTILEWDDTGDPLRVKMDLTNKVRALEVLAKHHQLLTEHLNITGGIEVREYVGIPEEAP